MDEDFHPLTKLFVMLSSLATGLACVVVWFLWSFDRTPDGIRFSVWGAIWHAIALGFAATGVRFVVTLGATVVEMIRSALRRKRCAANV